jgi:hypothetical protein
LKEPTTPEEIREYMERREKHWLHRYGWQISFAYVAGIPVLAGLLYGTRYHRLSDALLILWVSIWAAAQIFLKLHERAELRRRKEYIAAHKQN